MSLQRMQSVLHLAAGPLYRSAWLASLQLRDACLYSTAAMAAPAPPVHATGEDPLAALHSLADDSQKAGLTPTAIVDRLDKFIVGQKDAKRAVAIALRNRWRRHKIPPPICDEIVPKNILMIGPTGCGKTEIARRLAKLADAPFIKVEATKYTELGFVGRDVEDIVKDLVENSVTLMRQKVKEKILAFTARKVEDQIITALCGPASGAQTVETFKQLYRDGRLDDREVEIDVPASSSNESPYPLFAVDRMLRPEKVAGSRRTDKRRMKVKDAKQLIEEAEAEKYLASEAVTREALKAAEQDGIVFIDEIDKIVESSNRYVSGSVSSEGVQRDLLPIIEGCTVSTKYGNVSTDHMLFICSGAFHSCKPSDMLAELQGRLPIRVELKGLTANDFYKILTEPQHNMIKQQQALLATEGVELQFTERAVRAVAQSAAEANMLLDNIGARRLHTVMERILADLSYSAPDLVAAARAGGSDVHTHVVDEEHVSACMQPLLIKQDLSKYVL